MALSSHSPTWRTRLARLLRAKNIVIVSQHAVDHYALSFRMQCLLLLGIISAVAIVSFSTGRYIHTQQDLVTTERTLEATQAENDKISSEFTLLKKDLLKLNDDDEKVSDYTQFVLEQYEGQGELVLEVDETLKPIGTSSSSTLLDRVNYLESRLERVESDRQDFIRTIEELTHDKVQLLEEALEITGMEDEMSSLIDSKVREALPKDGAEPAQGGPFSPYDGEAAETAQERALLANVAYLAEINDVMQHLPLAHPMKNARFTSGFGKRMDPFRRRLARHEGIDYAGRMLAPVHATAPGKVVFAGYRGAYGRSVEIDHGNGITTRYAHLSRIRQRRGTYVKHGQEIGLQGNSGRSTGHHLHYEIRYHGKAINPAQFIKAGRYVSKKKT